MGNKGDFTLDGPVAPLLELRKKPDAERETLEEHESRAWTGTIESVFLC